jgi:hypothetical protein
MSSRASRREPSTDPLGQGFWIFNLDTKALGLSVGSPSYEINVWLNGTQITNTYGLFTPTK